MSYVHVRVLQILHMGSKLKHELIVKFSAKNSKAFNHEK